MLTAREAVRDRVAGLDSGADDYLVKPFALAELLARLRSLTRRGRPERPTIVRVGDLTLDPAAREVCRGADPIELSAKEFALLDVLMRRCGDVLTRLELIEQAWDMAYEVRSNVIDVYMGRLRRKIDEPYGVRTLETVRGVGYRLQVPG
jgi:two-component system OmpR family response regulator